jgi:argininosuccinate lyase
LDKSVYDVLGVEKAVAAMASHGSTNPGQVEEQVRRWKKALG